MTKNRESSSFSSASAQIAWMSAFPLLFVVSIAVYGLGHFGMPTAVPHADGSTAYFLRSWVGAMFWPVGTFLFGVYGAVGYWIGKRRVDADFARPLRLQHFLSFVGVTLVPALILPEMAGESPFRHFYCVVVSKETVVLHSGLWSRRIPRPDVADVAYNIRNYNGKKEFRYPVLRVRDTTGRVWRSVEEQCIADEPKLQRYETFMLDVRQQIVPGGN